MHRRQAVAYCFHRELVDEEKNFLIIFDKVIIREVYFSDLMHIRFGLSLWFACLFEKYNNIILFEGFIETCRHVGKKSDVVTEVPLGFDYTSSNSTYHFEE